MNKLFIILFVTYILYVSNIFCKKSKDNDKPEWAKKDIRDFSDADMER